MLCLGCSGGGGGGGTYMAPPVGRDPGPRTEKCHVQNHEGTERYAWWRRFIFKKMFLIITYLETITILCRI